MTTARSVIVDVDATPYYHCIARCVRRAFLCGLDEYSGRSFDHRKLWILERIKLLASIFAVDVCAYAMMSNHLHLVLRVVLARAAGWSDEEVLDRVGRLCPTSVRGLDRWTAPQRQKRVATWRARLSNLSWFMAKLDEHIARRANEEDGCGGRFWEGRFKSRALLDDGALLTCMAYVDLNPVRAGIAQGLEDSSWTSVQQRLREVAAALAREKAEPTVEPRAPSQLEPEPSQCPALAPMADDPRGGASDRLPLSLVQYVALLEWTGRAARQDATGHITAPPPELLTRCGLAPDRWLDGVWGFGSLRGSYVGHPSRLRQRASEVGRRWLKGQGSPVVAYSTAA
jgi:REP element-mobilizing transposase RayT